MRTSPKIGTVAAGLFAVQRDLKQPVKDAKGQIRGNPDYRYLSLNALIEHVKEPMREHSLFFTQEAVESERGVGILTVIWSVTGEWVEFGPLVMPHGADGQSVGSAVSYGRRYQLLSVLGLAAEDDDGSQAKPPAASSPTQEEPQPPPAVSGRDGAAEDVGATAYGEGAVAPASPTDAQRWMDEFHPGKPHRMKQSDTVRNLKFCTQGNGKCPYAVEVANA